MVLQQEGKPAWVQGQIELVPLGCACHCCLSPFNQCCHAAIQCPAAGHPPCSSTALSSHLPVVGMAAVAGVYPMPPSSMAGVNAEQEAGGAGLSPGSTSGCCWRAAGVASTPAGLAAAAAAAATIASTAAAAASCASASVSAAAARGRWAPGSGLASSCCTSGEDSTLHKHHSKAAANGWQGKGSNSMSRIPLAQQSHCQCRQQPTSGQSMCPRCWLSTRPPTRPLTEPPWRPCAPPPCCRRQPPGRATRAWRPAPPNPCAALRLPAARGCWLLPRRWRRLLPRPWLPAPPGVWCGGAAGCQAGRTARSQSRASPSRLAGAHPPCRRASKYGGMVQGWACCTKASQWWRRQRQAAPAAPAATRQLLTAARLEPRAVWRARAAAFRIPQKPGAAAHLLSHDQAIRRCNSRS